MVSSPETIHLSNSALISSCTSAGISSNEATDLSKTTQRSRSVRAGVMAINSWLSLPPMAPPSPMMALKSKPLRVKIRS